MYDIYSLFIVFGCSALVSTEYLDFNFNPAAPEHVHAHIFTFGNGSVPIAEGPNPFANNALDGSVFMKTHLGWEDEIVSLRRKEALDFWHERFGIDGEELMQNGQGVVLPYQISPEVNERAYMMNMPCHTPPEGYEVVDGGFQLFVTHPDGVEVPDPVTGEAKLYPFQTNLVYSWLRIHVRDANEDCGLQYPPPEWIVLRYQTLEPAKWTLNAIVFELEVIGENFFGTGRSLGISAPIVSATTITNRLLNYITFETAGPEADLMDLNLFKPSAAPEALKVSSANVTVTEDNFTQTTTEQGTTESIDNQQTVKSNSIDDKDNKTAKPS